MTQGYATPDKLVSTEWLTENLNNPDIRIVECDEDVLLYDTGHVPGAVKVDWVSDLNDPVLRDYLTPENFAAFASRIGITPETTVVFYGDKNNWWAAYSLWVFELFGHTNAKLLNGGRKKWVAEERELTKEVPTYTSTEYPLPTRDDSKIRAFRDEVLAYLDTDGALVDVRSPGEFSGELMHMADYPQEGTLRGGHIPGAANIPWAKAANEDGTFKSYADLKALYDGAGVTGETPIISYCRIGERSSHTWFVLHYLLGYDDVRNYDGSWTEWGNSVRVPIETGA